MTPTAARATIRVAAPSDLSVIDEIEGASFTVDRIPRRNIARLLRTQTAQFLLSEEAGSPTGYVLLLFRRRSRIARLYSLAVLSSARGGGVARRLVHAAMQCVIERGFERIGLEVRQSNLRAIRLYEDAGFQNVKALENYYEDGETALKMEKYIAPPTEGDA